MVIRLFKNAAWSKRRVEKTFSTEQRNRIEQAVKDAERGHAAEIAVYIEGAMPLLQILRGVSPRKRAEQVFLNENIGITAGKTGILVYILMAEKKVEILSDSAVIVSSGTLEDWVSIFTSMARSSILEAITGVVREIGAYSKENFSDSQNRDAGNELSDKPKII